MGVSPIPPAISLLPRDGCASGLRYRRGVGDYLDRSEAPAHPSNALISQLNKNWRVVDEDLTVLGTAAASDRMADKPLVVVRLNCTKAMPPPGPCGRVWPRPTQSGTAKSSVIWFGFPVQPCEIRSEASPAASR